MTPLRLTLKAKMYNYFPPPYQGGCLVYIGTRGKDRYAYLQIQKKQKKISN